MRPYAAAPIYTAEHQQSRLAVRLPADQSQGCGAAIFHGILKTSRLSAATGSPTAPSVTMLDHEHQAKGVWSLDNGHLKTAIHFFRDKRPVPAIILNTFAAEFLPEHKQEEHEVKIQAIRLATPEP
jgi:hypothetical protein